MAEEIKENVENESVEKESTEKNLLDLFAACPFCGTRKRLVLSDAKGFYNRQTAYGDACICISCMECSVDMYEHTNEERKYEHRVRLLARKWNSVAFGD